MKHLLLCQLKGNLSFQPISRSHNDSKSFWEIWHTRRCILRSAEVLKLLQSKVPTSSSDFVVLVTWAVYPTNTMPYQNWIKSQCWFPKYYRRKWVSGTYTIQFCWKSSLDKVTYFPTLNKIFDDAHDTSDMKDQLVLIILFFYRWLS